MITQRLADLAAGKPAHAIPEAAFAASVNALIDTLGVAMAGAHEPVSDIAAAWIADLGAKPQATVWGRKLATHAAEAAFANGISAHALDFDDSHRAPAGI
jgi:2-methylcitrate dehydratase PrpD